MATTKKLGQEVLVEWKFPGVGEGLKLANGQKVKRGELIRGVAGRSFRAPVDMKIKSFDATGIVGEIRAFEIEGTSLSLGEVWGEMEQDIVIYSCFSETRLYEGVACGKKGIVFFVDEDPTLVDYEERLVGVCVKKGREKGFRSVLNLMQKPVIFLRAEVNSKAGIYLVD